MRTVERWDPTLLPDGPYKRPGASRLQDNALYPASMSDGGHETQLGRSGAVPAKRGPALPPGWRPPAGSPIQRRPGDSSRRPVPTLDGIPLSHTEFRLRWPRNLFAGEARVVARRSENAQELLLRDAFVDPWIADSMQHHEVRPDKVLIYLADHVGHLPEGPVLRPTYQQRQAVASDDDDVDARTLLPLTFAYLVKDLTDRGYFARELTVRDVVSQAPLVTGAPSLLQGQLGWGPPNWPLDPNDVTEEGRLFDVIEVLHRHVARPRAIQPGWDDGYGDGYPPTYDDFSPAIGRAIYRHHVNKMLDEAQVPLRLADDGEDAGPPGHGDQRCPDRPAANDDDPHRPDDP